MHPVHQSIFQIICRYCNILTPLSIGSCAEDSDAYLIAFHPSQSDLSAGNDQTSPPLIEAVEDTDYKTNEIEQNLVCMNLCVRLAQAIY
jgi:hypothetical protein